MATRKQLWHPDDVKAKIQASQLINRLTEHALSQTPIMDASQVTAATKLLGKVVPDLKAIDLNGTIEHEAGSELKALLEAINGKHGRIPGGS